MQVIGLVCTHCCRAVLCVRIVAVIVEVFGQVLQKFRGVCVQRWGGLAGRVRGSTGRVLVGAGCSIMVCSQSRLALYSTIGLEEV